MQVQFKYIILVCQQSKFKGEEIVVFIPSIIEKEESVNNNLVKVFS